MMLLAIDTASRVMSIALHDDTTLLAEHSWNTGRRHTIELAPAIQNMLDACDVSVNDLTGIGVSVGPGSYTGVRIGVSLAKGLAGVSNLPIVGVTTLDSLAAGQPQFQGGTGLIAVVQAGRGRIIIKSYRWRKGQWSGRAEPRLMSWDELMDTLDGPAYITGEINTDGVDAIEAARTRDIAVEIAPAAFRLRRAGFLAQLAIESLNEAAQNSGDDLSMFAPAKVAPIYVKSDDQ